MATSATLAQLQIRQNANEVQDYIKDLFDWEDTMKRKDRAVATSSSKDGNQSALPAPRGRAVSKVGDAPAELQRPGIMPSAKPNGASSAQKSDTKKRKKKKTSAATVVDPKLAGTAAAHTYSSYSKWDKLNLDDEDSVSEYETDDEDSGAGSQQHQPAAVVPAPRVQAPTALPTSDHKDLPPIRNAEPQTCEEWRVRGNDLFKVSSTCHNHTFLPSRSVELRSYHDGVGHVGFLFA